MKLFIFSFIFILSGSAIAQIQIPYNHTYEGKMIFNNYNSYLENEYSVLHIPLESEFEKLEKGSYKLIGDPQIRKAYISYNTKKITVRDDSVKEAVKKKIKIEDVEYFKLGVDSFFVTNEKLNKKRIVKHVATFDSIVFAQYKQYYPNGYLKALNFIKKVKGSDKPWRRVFLKGEALKENLVMPFGKVSSFLNRKEIKSEDFLKCLTELKYLHNFKNDQKLYFSENWQQLTNSNTAFYYSKVTKKKGSVYSVEYFTTDNQKIYEVNYSEFNPNKKTGALNIYDKGLLVEERMYKNNDLQKVSSYLANGTLNFSYDCVKTDLNKVSKVSFTTITTAEGNTVEAPINGEFSLKGTDENIKHVFNDSKIVNSYYIDNGDKIYFFNGEKNIKMEDVRMSLMNHLHTNANFNQKKFKADLEGTILLDIITNKKGKVTSYTILNTLNNSLDGLFKSFCFLKFSDKASFKIKFKGIKVPEKNAYCRFVIPFTFGYKNGDQTFIKPNNNYYDHFWHQQILFQQQQFNQPIPIKLPTINRF